MIASEVAASLAAAFLESESWTLKAKRFSAASIGELDSRITPHASRPIQARRKAMKLARCRIGLPFSRKSSHPSLQAITIAPAYVRVYNEQPTRTHRSYIWTSTFTSKFCSA